MAQIKFVSLGWNISWRLWCTHYQFNRSILCIWFCIFRYFYSQLLQQRQPYLVKDKMKVPLRRDYSMASCYIVKCACNEPPLDFIQIQMDSLLPSTKNNHTANRNRRNSFASESVQLCIRLYLRVYLGECKYVNYELCAWKIDDIHWYWLYLLLAALLRHPLCVSYNVLYHKNKDSLFVLFSYSADDISRDFHVNRYKNDVKRTKRKTVKSANSTRKLKKTK